MAEHNNVLVAYFSMEIGLEPGIPTYSGGLGMLAGDTVRSAADLKIPMAAVSLLYRKGYFHQKLDASGWQTEEPVAWSPEKFLKETGARTTVTIEGRIVHLRSWLYEVASPAGGSKVPVYLLDSDLPENAEWDRRLTDTLYGGDPHYRIFQEILLGIGGVRMLRALGYDLIKRFHMNEGHAAFLVLELVEEQMLGREKKAVGAADIEAVRHQCVFTTHTPVPAGHDRFPTQLVHQVLGGPLASELEQVCSYGGELNMTHLALNMSHYVNGVAKKHGKISQQMFPHYDIDSITNGVHAATWTAPPFQELYDKYLPEWRSDNFNLRYALGIPRLEIRDAHRQRKKELLDLVNQKTGGGFDPAALTLGFARRAAAYKRAALLFEDVGRLKSIAAAWGAIQVVYAGKAHPHDHEGKEMIKRIHHFTAALEPHVKVVYLDNYDMELGKLITSGVDVLLNTPEPPLEASGTSGMKAALNGVPSLSILDGWWIEGCIEGITGWAIGSLEDTGEGHERRARDAASLYDRLEEAVLPAFYKRHDQFINIMRHAIALNGAFFNTQRMMQQYVVRAYFG